MNQTNLSASELRKLIADSQEKIIEAAGKPVYLQHSLRTFWQDTADVVKVHLLESAAQTTISMLNGLRLGTPEHLAAAKIAAAVSKAVNDAGKKETKINPKVFRRLQLLNAKAQSLLVLQMMKQELAKKQAIEDSKRHLPKKRRA